MVQLISNHPQDEKRIVICIADLKQYKEAIECYDEVNLVTKI
ncbi:unnamed protein product [Paramecium octaurelia]|uniref:Uncharacterized protein n=1 Tax=Paramecium octaurelia TaxID=43137 RepID=A0A8S1YPI9_PAROT|nr:unnamed protein product [Paramecium octaurelia]